MELKQGDKVKIRGRKDKETYFIVHSVGEELAGLHREGKNSLFPVKIKRLMKIDIPKKLEDIKDERYFQIRDLDSNGCGSCETFCVSAETSNEEVFQIASDLWTERMEQKESLYIPSFFRERPKWRQTIKVVEQNRNTEKLPEPDKNGKDFRNIWTTKKKGLKFTITNNWIKIKKGSIINEPCFVAEKEGFYAHGETVKKAIGDLQFKIVAERLKNEPIEADTLLTVNHYRTITGACDMGVRSWMQSNNIPYKIENDKTVEVEPIAAKDLLPLLKKTSAYGYEKFKSLLTF